MTHTSRVAAVAVAAGALIAAFAMSGAPVAAQPARPIYLQYDGFVRNKDGSTTLSFGYFNTNNADVSIAAGEANMFTPGAADRGQPVRFLKGKHRFACSMVVDKAFDGKLQWTVKYSGHSETTTAQALDPLYELDEATAKHALTGLDLAGGQKNVCLDRAPSLTLVSPTGEAVAFDKASNIATRVDQEAGVYGVVDDDGLPRGSKVEATWTKASGPGTVTFADPHAATTHVTFSAPGAYVLDLSATDGRKSSSMKVNVAVSQALERAPDEYTKTMKDIGATQAELRTHATAKDYGKIAEDADKLKALFATTAAFWQPRNMADANKFADAGAKAVADLDAAAKAKNDGDVTNASRALGATCQGCHAAHRERRPDGSFMIK